MNVPNGTSSTIAGVAPGRYYIVVRYGSDGQYWYTREESFEIEQTSHSYSDVRITLHPVVGGNYETFPASASEFERAALRSGS
ncbi:MAG: hypothetical protein NZ899_13045 [Thermoguttaceae bacterium]|nr:hypothetical protein [Thermoguttaceae bacterium]MDW8079996.1 hypothetical protein [Thermoguttaceae bacterium]